MKRSITVILLALMVMAFASVSLAQVQAGILPNPVLVFNGAEYFENGGKQYTKYKYFVFNDVSYPDTLFAAAPELPACGTNTKASRTWVDIYDQRGKQLQEFCALGKNRDLNLIWFAVETSEIPPSWVYVEFNDRKTGNKYKSNLAETTL